MYNENLSVINTPDSLGLACNFTPFSFYLGGKRTYWNLPNNANYNLGSMTGSICDSLTIDISEITTKKLVAVFPNPANDFVSIDFEGHNNYSLKIFNELGEIVFQQIQFSNKEKIDLSALNTGIYFIMIDNIFKDKLIIIRK
jgi:hypothetical protein